MPCRSALPVLLAACALNMMACRGSNPSSPTASEIPLPPPVLPPAQIAGTWSGIYTADIIPVAATGGHAEPASGSVTLILTQDGARIGGTFTLGGFAGQITGGTVTFNEFTGELSLDRSSCPNRGSFSGSTTAVKLHWQGSFSGGFCSVFLPQHVVIDAQRP